MRKEKLPKMCSRSDFIAPIIAQKRKIEFTSKDGDVVSIAAAPAVIFVIVGVVVVVVVVVVGVVVVVVVICYPS